MTGCGVSTRSPSSVLMLASLAVACSGGGASPPGPPGGPDAIRPAGPPTPPSRGDGGRPRHRGLRSARPRRQRRSDGENSSTSSPARCSRPATTRTSTPRRLDFRNLLRPSMGPPQEPHLPEPGQPRVSVAGGAAVFRLFRRSRRAARRRVLQLHARELAHHLAQQRGRRLAGPGHTCGCATI